MSLFISSLNSGSNGNCYYVGTSTEAVLVDAGISCREIEKRMKRLRLKIENIKAVFVSHEHSDHIKGLPVLIKKYQFPVYITPLTRKYGSLTFDDQLVKTFNSHEAVNIGQLSITAFPKSHDASDPYSFIISFKKICVGVFTDIGIPCENLKKYFQQCHAAFLEANYDEEMLEKGNYPFHLKKRIRGGKGHLSNRQALEVFLNHRPHFMTHLLLSHLSKNNNCPDLVQRLFNEHCENVKVTIASRYQETEVFQIDWETSVIPAEKKMRKPSFSQLALSFS